MFLMDRRADNTEREDKLSKSTAIVECFLLLL